MTPEETACAISANPHVPNQTIVAIMGIAFNIWTKTNEGPAMIEALLAARLRHAALIITLSVLLTAPASRRRDAAEEYPFAVPSRWWSRIPPGVGVDTVGRVIAQRAHRQRLVSRWWSSIVRAVARLIGTRDVAEGAA